MTTQDAYASHFGKYRRVLDRVLDHDPAMFDLPLNARIADIGCGYGDLLKLLRSRGYSRLVGVEPDPLCRASSKFYVSNGTLEDTGLATASIDSVIVNNVFHHVADYRAALVELTRILKPNGLLCFIEPLNTIWRFGMDFLTFHTPLRFVPPVNARHRVMRLELETGLYPQWLKEQESFHSLLTGNFDRIWFRRGWLFQFGKYRKHQL